MHNSFSYTRRLSITRLSANLMGSEILRVRTKTRFPGSRFLCYCRESWTPFGKMCRTWSSFFSSSTRSTPSSPSNNTPIVERHRCGGRSGLYRNSSPFSSLSVAWSPTEKDPPLVLMALTMGLFQVVDAVVWLHQEIRDEKKHKKHKKDTRLFGFYLLSLSKLQLLFSVTSCITAQVWNQTSNLDCGSEAI
jgi:hypothetical protein